MDQGEAHSIRSPRDDLVAEHGPGRCATELLDVGAAEPAREHAHRVAGSGRVREPGLSLCVEYDRAHARIVGMDTLAVR